MPKRLGFIWAVLIPTGLTLLIFSALYLAFHFADADGHPAFGWVFVALNGAIVFFTLKHRIGP